MRLVTDKPFYHLPVVSLLLKACILCYKSIVSIILIAFFFTVSTVTTAIFFTSFFSSAALVLLQLETKKSEGMRVQVRNFS
jgi:hypothetical protein